MFVFYGPTPVFLDLLMQSFLQSPQQTYLQLIGHVLYWLTRLVFISGINSTGDESPGYVCNVVS